MTTNTDNESRHHRLCLHPPSQNHKPSLYPGVCRICLVQYSKDLDLYLDPDQQILTAGPGLVSRVFLLLEMPGPRHPGAPRLWPPLDRVGAPV